MTGSAPEDGAAPATAVPLEVLTDEELHVLHGGVPTVVVEPHLAALADGPREWSLRTAYRGLLARGLLEPPTAAAPTDPDGSGTADARVREDVHAVVTLRAAPDAVLCAARTTSLGQDFWYAHVVADVVLVEQVDAGGLHHFAVAPADDLPDLLTAATVHPEATDGTGPALAVGDPAAPERATTDLLARAELRTDLVLRTPGDTEPMLTGLFTGPDGAWLLTARPGTDDPLTAVPVTRADLLGHLHKLAARALSARANRPAGEDAR